MMCAVMKKIDFTYRFVQGKDTILQQQTDCFRKLCTSLKTICIVQELGDELQHFSISSVSSPFLQHDNFVTTMGGLNILQGKLLMHAAL